MVSCPKYMSMYRSDLVDENMVLRVGYDGEYDAGVVGAKPSLSNKRAMTYLRKQS
jgi:hypothetical protein